MRSGKPCNPPRKVTRQKTTNSLPQQSGSMASVPAFELLHTTQTLKPPSDSASSAGSEAPDDPPAGPTFAELAASGVASNMAHPQLARASSPGAIINRMEGEFEEILRQTRVKHKQELEDMKMSYEAELKSHRETYERRLDDMIQIIKDMGRSR